jgi:hypothetical protein
LKYHQPGDATTFKSVLNEYGKDGEVLGLVVGYSGEASSDVHRVADLVATRLASKHLEYVRTSASIAKAMQTTTASAATAASAAPSPTDSARRDVRISAGAQTALVRASPGAPVRR